MEELENRLTHMVRSMQAEIKAMKKEQGEMKTQIHDLMAENETLKAEVTELRGNQEATDLTLDDHENRSKRNNLVIHNLDPVVENESWGDCQKAVQTLIAEKLKIKEPIEIERAHRMGMLRPGRTRPVVVKFLKWGDKEKVKKSGKKLSGTNIFINEDFSARIRAHRRALVKYAKDNADGRKWTVQYNTLIMDSKPYHFDEERDMVVERRARAPREQRPPAGEQQEDRRRSHSREAQ